MKVLETILELQEIAKEHGDVHIYITNRDGEVDDLNCITFFEGEDETDYSHKIDPFINIT